MSRRKTDTLKVRVLVLAVCLAVSTSVLAAWLGYKSLRAITAFDKFVDLMLTDSRLSKHTERF